MAQTVGTWVVSNCDNELFWRQARAQISLKKRSIMTYLSMNFCGWTLSMKSQIILQMASLLSAPKKIKLQTFSLSLARFSTIYGRPGLIFFVYIYLLWLFGEKQNLSKVPHEECFHAWIVIIVISLAARCPFFFLVSEAFSVHYSLQPMSQQTDWLTLARRKPARKVTWT